MMILNKEVKFYIANTDEWSDKHSEIPSAVIGNISTLGISFNQSN